jgi:hypothetical protein
MSRAVIRTHCSRRRLAGGKIVSLEAQPGFPIRVRATNFDQPRAPPPRQRRGLNRESVNVETVRLMEDGELSDASINCIGALGACYRGYIHFHGLPEERGHVRMLTENCLRPEHVHRIILCDVTRRAYCMLELSARHCG